MSGLHWGIYGPCPQCGAGRQWLGRVPDDRGFVAVEECARCDDGVYLTWGLDLLVEQALRIMDSSNDPREDVLWAYALMARFGRTYRDLRQKVMDAAVTDLWAIKTGLAQ